MDFRRFNPDTFYGKFIRLPLKLIPGSAWVTILSGRIKGYKWRVGSAPHSCWLGTYEHDMQQAYAALLKPGDCVFDVGANAGFYSLIASRLTGPEGQVHSFEPLPENLAFLRDHISRNNIKNVLVIEKAVCDTVGEVSFGLGVNRFEAKISGSGELTVPSVSLDEYIKESGSPYPVLIKIDVEGAEAMVLQGASELITAALPHIFLSTHGDEVKRECADILEKLDYCLIPIDQGTFEAATEFHAKPRAETSVLERAPASAFSAPRTD